MHEPSANPELTVYFDGSCPLCRREIAFYRRLRGAERLQWLDVSAGAPLCEDLSCEAAMRRFHVRDAQGRLLSGGAAFARLWRALPGWRVAGSLLAWPPMSWALELAYRAFLPLRPRLQGLVRRWWPDTETST
jgi:predicted DCC family thiol-disulfide oxidoreductase YuxK